jgi:hypothetical protein
MCENFSVVPVPENVQIWHIPTPAQRNFSENSTNLTSTLREGRGTDRQIYGGRKKKAHRSKKGADLITSNFHVQLPYNFIFLKSLHFKEHTTLISKSHLFLNIYNKILFQRLRIAAKNSFLRLRVKNGLAHNVLPS